MTQPNTRKGWIAMLAKLVQPGDPTAAAAALAAMLPRFVDFPDAAFTIQSLDHVAQQCRRLPSYAELRTALSAWWREHKPPQTTIAAPDQWASRIAAERAQAVADWSDPVRVRAAMRTVLSGEAWQLQLGRCLAALVLQHAPKNAGLLPPEWVESAVPGELGYAWMVRTSTQQSIRRAVTQEN